MICTARTVNSIVPFFKRLWRWIQNIPGSTYEKLSLQFELMAIYHPELLLPMVHRYAYQLLCRRFALFLILFLAETRLRIEMFLEKRNVLKFFQKMNAREQSRFANEFFCKATVMVDEMVRPLWKPLKSVRGGMDSHFHWCPVSLFLFCSNISQMIVHWHAHLLRFWLFRCR